MDTGALNILVTDDDPSYRTTICNNLQQQGYAVEEADSGLNALQLMRQHRYDVVVLDLTMPEKDGFHVLSVMKADHDLRHVPVIAISTADDMATVIRALEIGAFDHLSKPIDLDLLHSQIQTALSHRQGENGLNNAAERDERGGQDSDTEPETGTGFAAFGRCLLDLTKPYRIQTSLYLVIMAASLGIEAALPLGITFITDHALIPADFEMLILILSVLMAAAVGSTVLQSFADHLYARIGNKLLNDLRFRMYRHLQYLPTSYFKRIPAGETTARFSTDFAALENTILFPLPGTIGQVIVLISTLALLFFLEWRLALVSLVGLYISYKGAEWMEPKASAASYRVKFQQAKLQSLVQENIQGASIIKMFGLQRMFIENFKHRMLRLYTAASRASFLSYMTERVSEQGILLFNLLIFCVGAYLAFEGFLTVGELLAFQVLLNGLTVAVGELTWGLPNLIQAAVGMRRIEELLDEKPEMEDQPGAPDMTHCNGEVVLDNVSFSYDGKTPTLENISLTIPPKSNVLFVGPSGCGKSTVLNMIMRLYDPAKGSVSVGGKDLREVNRNSLRRHMSVVLQDSFLFNASIQENIRLGHYNVPDAAVEEAAKAAEIHDIILAMTDGYDTLAGEAGGQLSGGQRQRIAIARAIVADPALLLLDEATSALDPPTAQSINSALKKISRGRTMISVTHRLESAPEADLIFVFNKGRLAEQGNHTQLLAKPGIYAQLWRKQAGFSLDNEGGYARVGIERLREIPILGSIEKSTLSHVAELFVTEHVAANRTVVYEGDPGDRFYIVVRGRVEVTRETTAGDSQHIAMLDDGDYFGEIALLNRVPRTATVRAVSDTILLSLANEHFQKLLAADSDLRKTLEAVSKSRTLNQHDNSG